MGTLSAYMNAHFSVAQEVDFCCRIIVAAIVGGIIGFERSHRFKEAGFRTHVIVCCTTCILMILSKYGFADLEGADGVFFSGTRGADTSRIAAQAVSGISFLCAGVIFKTGSNIRGLTTAAGLWLTANLGLVFGAGMYVIGIFSTTFLAFIAAGVTAIHQIDSIPKPFAALIHASILYIDYLGIYLLNGWMELRHLWIFTLFFLLVFALIWLSIYIPNRIRVEKMNKMLES